jgi:hypothetical protein
MKPWRFGASEVFMALPRIVSSLLGSLLIKNSISFLFFAEAVWLTSVSSSVMPDFFTPWCEGTGCRSGR